jgi:hypothetical protein
VIKLSFEEDASSIRDEIDIDPIVREVIIHFKARVGEIRDELAKREHGFIYSMRNVGGKKVFYVCNGIAMTYHFPNFLVLVFPLEEIERRLKRDEQFMKMYEKTDKRMYNRAKQRYEANKKYYEELKKIQKKLKKSYQILYWKLKKLHIKHFLERMGKGMYIHIPRPQIEPFMISAQKVGGVNKKIDVLCSRIEVQSKRLGAKADYTKGIKKLFWKAFWEEVRHSRNQEIAEKKGFFKIMGSIRLKIRNKDITEPYKRYLNSRIPRGLARLDIEAMADYTQSFIYAASTLPQAQPIASYGESVVFQRADERFKKIRG